MLSEKVANSGCSFSNIASFIDQLEVTFKQAGSLLTASDFVFKLARFLITVLTLAKKFLGDMNDHEDVEPALPLYRFVRQQCKGCIRKGLKVVSLLYNKFYFVPAFLEDLS